MGHLSKEIKPNPIGESPGYTSTLMEYELNLQIPRQHRRDSRVGTQHGALPHEANRSLVLPCEAKQSLRDTRIRYAGVAASAAVMLAIELRAYEAVRLVVEMQI